MPHIRIAKISRKTNCQGIGHLVTLLAIVIIGMLGFAGKFVWDKQQTAKTSASAPVGSPVRPTTSDSAAATATVKGIISRGPTSPVCHQGQACSQVVLNATVQFVDSRGTIAASSSTDSSGHYHATLPVGTYTLKVDPAIGTLQPGQITLHSGDNQLDIIADSGIR